MLDTKIAQPAPIDVNSIKRRLFFLSKGELLKLYMKTLFSCKNMKH